MTRNAQDIIDDMRNIVKPRIAKMLLEANFEGCGKEDKAEFETEFEVLLTLAERGATVEPQSDLISRKEVAEILNHQRFGIAQISWDIISEKIKALPPVEPQEWISPTAEPVSTEEAKKLLYQEFKGKMKDGNPRLLVAYEIAIKALEEQTEWIPVTGRLPEKSGIYYVTIQDKNGYRYVAKDRFYYDHKYFKHINYYKCLDSEIIAWQPITEPSPYKGDTE